MIVHDKTQLTSVQIFLLTKSQPKTEIGQAIAVAVYYLLLWLKVTPRFANG